MQHDHLISMCSLINCDAKKNISRLRLWNWLRAICTKKILKAGIPWLFFSFIQIFLTFYQGTVLSHVSYDDRISIFKRDLDKEITYQALITEFDHWNRLSCHAFVNFKRVFVASILAMVGLVVYRNVLTFCTLPCNFSFLSNRAMKLASKPQNLRQPS